MLGTFRRNGDAGGKIALRRLNIRLRCGGRCGERNERGGTTVRRALSGGDFRRGNGVARLRALGDAGCGSGVQIELRTGGGIGRWRESYFGWLLFESGDIPQRRGRNSRDAMLARMESCELFGADLNARS